MRCPHGSFGGTPRGSGEQTAGEEAQGARARRTRVARSLDRRCRQAWRQRSAAISSHTQWRGPETIKVLQVPGQKLGGTQSRETQHEGCGAAGRLCPPLPGTSLLGSARLCSATPGSAHARPAPPRPAHARPSPPLEWRFSTAQRSHPAGGPKWLDLVGARGQQAEQGEPRGGAARPAAQLWRIVDSALQAGSQGQCDSDASALNIGSRRYGCACWGARSCSCALPPPARCTNGAVHAWSSVRLAR